MTKLIQWLKSCQNYCRSFFKRDIVQLVIIRRYSTPSGYVGEVYLNGQQIAFSCDMLSYAPAVYRDKAERFVIAGEFTDRSPIGSLRFGAHMPLTNKIVKRQMLALCSRKMLELDVRNSFILEESI